MYSGLSWCYYLWYQLMHMNVFQNEKWSSLQQMISFIREHVIPLGLPIDLIFRVSLSILIFMSIIVYVKTKSAGSVSSGLSEKSSSQTKIFEPAVLGEAQFCNRDSKTISPINLLAMQAMPWSRKQFLHVLPLSNIFVACRTSESWPGSSLTLQIRGTQEIQL